MRFTGGEIAPTLILPLVLGVVIGIGLYLGTQPQPPSAVLAGLSGAAGGAVALLLAYGAARILRSRGTSDVDKVE